MKEFVCSKCKSSDVFISESGNHTGLYCADCGRWITWLNKEQLRLAEMQIRNNKNEDIKVLLERLSTYSMRDIRRACDKIGVSITNADYSYRNIYEVIIDVYDKTNKE